MARHQALHQVLQRKRRGVRTAAAVIGACAVAAMTALGVAIEQGSDGAMLAMGKITMGATSTQTTPPNAPAVGVARPAIKGPAPLPPEQEAAK